MPNHHLGLRNLHSGPEHNMNHWGRMLKTHLSRIVFRLDERKKDLFVFFLAAFLVSAMFPAPGHAGDLPVLILNHDTEAAGLGPYLEYFFDPSRKLSIEDVSSAAIASNFKPLKADAVNFGFTPAAVWLRFRLIGNPEASAHCRDSSWILDLGRPLEQHLQLFFATEAGTWTIKTACANPPCPDSDGFREAVFRLPPSTGQIQDFFLKIETRTAVQFFPEVLTEMAFRKKSKRRMLAQGLYFGLCLTMILYNFSIFLFLRDRTFLWYVLYVAFLGIYLSITHGVSPQFLPFIRLDDLIRADLICLGLFIFFASQFTRSFLMTRATVPRIDRIIRIYMAADIITTALTCFVNIMYVLPIFSFFGFIAPVVALTPGVLSLKRGFTPARFFILGWILFTGGTLVFVASYAGLIPLTIWEFHAFQIGSSMEIICLSLALGDRIRGLQISRLEFKEQAIKDDLTGLFNRRHMFRVLNDHLARSGRSGQVMSLLMLDVDYFKAFNDTYGHPEGDKALAGLARVIMTSIREKDIPCRYGGEEFGIILPQANLGDAWVVAERIRKKFSGLEFHPMEGITAGLTVSIGAAVALPGESADHLIQRADQALYQAKESGRNRTVS